MNRNNALGLAAGRIVFVTAASTLLSGCDGKDKAQKQRLNIIYIMTDDHAPSFMELAGLGIPADIQGFPMPLG